MVETREWDAQGEILFMNNYGLDFFGFKAEYLVGRNVVGTIVAPSDSEGYNLENKMKAVQKNPEAFYSSENENMKKDGGKVWIAWTNKGIYDENGLLLKTLSVGIDRTKQREKEIFCYEIFE
nr:PAS domain-containing protein [Desulfonema limicola]